MEDGKLVKTNGSNEFRCGVEIGRVEAEALLGVVRVRRRDGKYRRVLLLVSLEGGTKLVRLS